uniref:Uncharacterized protein n=1 Tax=Romanomermis culicivorax TaxID=13658 RepID=A0A915K8Y3_ROMCU
MGVAQLGTTHLRIAHLTIAHLGITHLEIAHLGIRSIRNRSHRNHSIENSITWEFAHLGIAHLRIAHLAIARLGIAHMEIPLCGSQVHFYSIKGTFCIECRKILIATSSKIHIYNDYYIESRSFLAFISRQGPIYSLKFLADHDMNRIFINGVKTFRFVDKALAKDNRTMTYIKWDGTEYVKKFTEFVHEERNYEI